MLFDISSTKLFRCMDILKSTISLFLIRDMLILFIKYVDYRAIKSFESKRCFLKIDPNDVNFPYGGYPFMLKTLDHFYRKKHLKNLSYFCYLYSFHPSHTKMQPFSNNREKLNNNFRKMHLCAWKKV